MALRQYSVLKDCLILFVCLGVVYFALMGSHPFLTPDEGRYVEIPREMLRSGNYLIPHLNGIPYFEKPPLFYWMQTLSLGVLGPSTWAMRAWISLLGVLACLSTYGVGQAIWTRRVGIVSAVIQATAFLYFGISHSITLDAPLTFFLTLSLHSLLYGIWRFDQKQKGYRRWLYCAYVFSALAVMTKGLIGVVFPLMIVGLWILITGRWALLLRLHIIPGLLLLLLICFPWHYWAWQEYPEFLKFYFIDQQFSRYATPLAHRAMSKISYFAILLLGLFPWTLFLPQALVKSWKEKTTGSGQYLLFFAVWGSSIFLFFLFSHSILVPYLLPIIAPFAMVIGAYLEFKWDQPLPFWLRAGLLGLCLILGLAFALAPYFRVMEPIALAWTHFIAIAILFWVTGCCAYQAGAKNTKSFVKALAMICIGLYAAMMMAMPYANTRSVKPLTTLLKPLLSENPTAKVVSFDEYYQDMTYYLERTVIVAGWRNELTFGMSLEPLAREWMIEIPEFWTLWDSGQLVYAIGPSWLVRDAEPHGPMCVLGKTIENVLLVNRRCES